MSGPRPEPFAGRRAELAALESALAAAREGHPQVVLLEGATGVGKTALIERFLAGHEDLRVLRASGEPAEQRIALGVVDQLLRRAGARADVLELLDGDAPTALVFDDAQWADQESIDALVFALRRLNTAPALAIVATRPGAMLDGVKRLAERRTGRRLDLAPISRDELHELAGGLSGAVVRRLWEHTEGDLRWVRALLAEVPPDTWRDFERPLPAPRDLAAAVAHRLATVGDEAERLVAAAAVLGSGCLLAEAATLAGTEASLEALEAAVTAGLVRAGRRGGLPTIEFAPPATAVAVHEQLGPSRRAALHRAAAALVDDEAAALLHLAAASAGPDAALAERLDGFARRCRERPEAAAALVAASHLSTTREQREDRLVRAVDWLLLAGDAAQARSHAAEVAECAPTARRDSVLGQIAVAGDRVRDAGTWLEAAWARCDREHDRELAATIAHRNAFHALIHLRDGEVVEWARRALELAPGHPLAVEWNATLALSLWRRGEREAAHDVLANALTGDLERDAQLHGMRAWLLIAGDDIGGSRDELAAAAAAELRLGALEIGVVHLNVLARAHFEVGAWDEAVAVADRAVAIASQLEDVSARVFVWWAAVLVPAARGDWAAADHFAERAGAEPTDAPDRVVAVGIARALVAAARGDAEAVIRTLAPVTDIGAAVDEPGFWPWQHLYADALVTSGRLDEAEAFLARHEALAADRGHATALARLTAAHGRLHAVRGDRARAEAAFQQAQVERPYDRALVQLAHGQFLRRDGQRRSAAALLTSAAETFAALGARPALERAERELVASGLRPSRRGEHDTAHLTPQELTVAQLVATGHSNREVAADLQLSVKTVEVHLTRIYAKLGIGSRTQLAPRLTPYASDPTT